jgi:hypothetical protein
MHTRRISTWRALLASALVVLLVSPSLVQAQAGFENPPVLKASDLAPAVLLKGPRFRVDDKVPVRGLLGVFTIHSDFGAFEAHGVEMLRIRVVEIAALDTLESTSKTDEFVKAAGTAAARPFKAGAHMVMNPKETAQGIGAGVSRFYDRAKMGVQHIAAGTSEPGKSDAEKAEDVTKRVGSVTIDVLGWEEERRALAKRLGVDPYTTNPVLAEKLSDFAWVTFSGRVGLNLAVSVVVPFSMILTATSVTNDMVWDLKPADVLKANAGKLATMGASEAQVTALLKNPWYSLTMLTWLTNGLGVLQGAAGRPDVVAFAAGARTEDEARFIASATNMIAAAHATTPVTAISTHGTVVARTGGGVVVPGQVDYIAWTKGAATFATRADLKASTRSLVITGRVSPRAAKELMALNWTVKTVAPLTPPAVTLPTTSR